MKLHNLKPSKGSKKKRKRVGRGNGSGLGTYSGKGIKGQKSRSGASFHPSFEGGKTPLVKLIPKIKGFKSFKQQPQILSISLMDKYFNDGDIIDKRKLKKLGLIKSVKSKAKLIANGKTKKKLSIIIDKASMQAVKIIEAAGGKVKVLDAVKKEKKDGKRKSN